MHNHFLKQSGKNTASSLLSFSYGCQEIWCLVYQQLYLLLLIIDDTLCGQE